MAPTAKDVQSLHGQMPGQVPNQSGTAHAVVWCARTAIEVMAVGAGVATLPVSVPLVVAVKVLEKPRRIVADSFTNGTAPLVGPPIARTLDLVLGYAA